MTQMTKTSQDNNLNYIIFLKHFCEYHTEKIKYRDIICLILKVLPWWTWCYGFCSHIQSLVELESVIVATTPYFEHNAPLTYSLCSHSALWNRILENLWYCNKINVHMYIVHEKMAGNFNMQLHSLCKTFKMVSRWVLRNDIYIYCQTLYWNRTISWKISKHFCLFLFWRHVSLFWKKIYVIHSILYLFEWPYSHAFCI